VAQVRIPESASCRLDEVYRYTRERWGVQQADRCVTGLFEACDGIEICAVFARPRSALRCGLRVRAESGADHTSTRGQSADRVLK
jgi:plasmid stabilization system protein ParE